MSSRFPALAFILVLLFLGGASAGQVGSASAAAPGPAVRSQMLQMPVAFVENRGQMEHPARYYVPGRDMSLYFSGDGVEFALRESKPGVGKAGRPFPRRGPHRPAIVRECEVRLDFLGARPGAQPKGEERAEGIVSYFRGKPSEWKTGIPTFGRLVYRDLWPGVDLAYSGSVSRVKYEFTVAAGAEPERIRLAYRGAEVRLDGEGRLEVTTPVARFHDDRPVAFQVIAGRRVPVAVEYDLDPDGSSASGERKEYGFRLGDYDRRYPLVIDPAVMIYCGFMGSGGGDNIDAIAVDSAGALYVAGATSGGMPATHDSALRNGGGGSDAWLAKIRPDGNGWIYLGYIGGGDADYAFDLTVDAAGNAYVVGETWSSQDLDKFPVVGGPDLTFNGRGTGDAFVAKVNPAGTRLISCGFIGGDWFESAYGVAVDGTQNVYIVGFTNSPSGFPLVTGPDLTANGKSECFVAKMRADASGLAYCGYIGGAQNDGGHGIVVNAAGEAFVTGSTNSSEGAGFPASGGPDLTFNGESDGFVAGVRGDGSGVLFCGYVGGARLDSLYGITIDSAGALYVCGFTQSDASTLPVTVGPDLTYNGNTDGLVAKLNPPGTSIAYCGYAGGSGGDRLYGIALDAGGNAYVTGDTTSSQTTLPVVDGPDLTYNGFGDALLARVNAAGTALDRCGYVGGSESDRGFAVAVDASGLVYVAGYTQSSPEAGFPVILGPDLTYAGGSDAFVAKIGPDTAAPVITFRSPSIDTVIVSPATIKADVVDAGDITWELRVDGVLVTSGSTKGANVVNLTRSLAPGLHTAEIRAVDNAGNSSTKSLSFSVTDNTPPAVTITSPLAGSTVNSPVTIRADVIDESSVTWEMRIDGVADTTGSSQGFNAVNVLRDLAPGSHTVEVRAWDSGGKSGSATRSFTVMGDTAAPAITIVSPGGGAQVTSPVSIRADITDSGSVTWELRVDGVLDSTGSGKGPNAVNVNRSLALGAHTLEVRATDNAGNVGTANRSFTVVPSDTTPPAITIVSPAAGAEAVNPISIRANITEATPITWELRIDGAVDTTGTTRGPGAIDVSRTLGVGEHTLEVRATDQAGNMGTASRTFMVAAVDADAPVVTFTAPVSGVTVTAPVPIRADISDASSVTWTLKIDGSETRTGTTKGPTRWT